MNRQMMISEGPRSLVKTEGPRALVECPAVTRAVGRTATDSEAFWYTAWDWDTQVIWATVRGFFDAYNMGRFDECLSYVSQKTGAGKDMDGVVDLLKQAKSSNEHISVESLTDLVITGSRASGTVNQIVRSDVVRQNMAFVRERDSWKISWPAIWNGNMFVAKG